MPPRSGIVDPLYFITTSKPANEQTKKLIEDLKRLMEEGGISSTTFISPHRQFSSRATPLVTEGPFDDLKLTVVKSRGDNEIKGPETSQEWIDEMKKLNDPIFRREVLGHWVEGDNGDTRVMPLPIDLKVTITLEGQKGTKTWDEAKVRLERRGPPEVAAWLPHTDEEVEREVHRQQSLESLGLHRIAWHGDRSNRWYTKRRLDLSIID